MIGLRVVHHDNATNATSSSSPDVNGARHGARQHLGSPCDPPLPNPAGQIQLLPFGGDGTPSGPAEVLVIGFAETTEALPAAAKQRPVGLAQATGRIALRLQPSRPANLWHLFSGRPTSASSGQSADTHMERVSSAHPCARRDEVVRRRRETLRGRRRIARELITRGYDPATEMLELSETCAPRLADSSLRTRSGGSGPI